MALLYKAGNIITGLSSDTKPTTNLPTGYRFYETDTFIQYIWDTVNWKQVTTSESSYKHSWNAGGSANMVGYLNALITNAGTVNRTVNTTNGAANTFATAATTNSPGGLKSTTTVTTVRGLNPRMRFRFKISSTTAIQMYAGWQNVITDPSGDDWLNGTGKAGFLFGKRSTDTTFQLMTNNLAAQATQFTDTGVTVDTNDHTVLLVADDTNARFGWSLDGSAISYISASVPIQGTNMGCMVEIATNENVAKTLSVYYWDNWQDK